jgi:epoxyqueuosine reductase QueG
MSDISNVKVREECIMIFHKRVQQQAEEWGADFFGIADLTPAKAAIAEQGGTLVAEFLRAISLGIELFHPIVDQLPQREERAVAVNYRHHCYDIINQRLDLLASRVGSVLQREGFRAMPIPSSKRADDERICAVFSHKLAAHLAGLGWIGKSCLLVTPEAGPRVRWITVLTDAPLTPTGGPTPSRCGSCRECVDICPAQAFTGEPFRKHEPREVRYDARKCEQYFDKLKAERHVAVCGLCLYVCPHGRKGGKA